MIRQGKTVNKLVQITPKQARRDRSCISPYVHSESTVNRSLWLYRVVFGIRLRIILWLVFLSVLTPPMPVAAMSDDEASLSNQVVESLIVSDPVMFDTDDLNQSIGDEITSGSESGMQSDEPELSISSDLTSTPRLEDDPEPVDLVIDSATSTEASSTTPSTRVDDDVGAEPGIDSAEPVPDEQSGLSSSSSNEASTTIHSAAEAVLSGPTQPHVSIAESDSHVTFSRSDCVAIENGTFYCQKAPEADVLPDGLFSAPDADGDLEIFLVRNGVRTQITHNYVDDASPFYDRFSNTIVWHRLIDDRYQIISFDVETGEEKQLTDTKVNNMEPARHGQYTVWQRWIDNNWEIVLHDGAKESRLTTSSEHDIAPRIRGSLVIWNTRTTDGAQQLQTYDIAQRTLTRITDAAGVAVQNPRMVVMFDEVHQNGDVITRGYDLLSGEVVPLSAMPRELPDKIPVSDGTGETRAIIQTLLTSPKSNDDVDDDEDPTTATYVPPEDDFVLDLTHDDIPVTPELHQLQEVPELDLSQILNIEADHSPTDEVPQIPDVVVPPYAETASSTQS